jgi:hypothetical protein
MRENLLCPLEMKSLIIEKKIRLIKRELLQQLPIAVKNDEMYVNVILIEVWFYNLTFYNFHFS